MGYTREYAETVIVGQIGSALLAAGRMATTHAGSNPDLNEPIRAALFNVGILATDPSSVADADVAQVSAGNLTNFLNGCVYNALNSLLMHLAVDVDRQVDQLGVKLSQRREAVEKMLQRMESSGMTGASIVGGVKAGAIAGRSNMPPEAIVRPRRFGDHWR